MSIYLKRRHLRVIHNSLFCDDTKKGEERYGKLAFITINATLNIFGLCGSVITELNF